MITSQASSLDQDKLAGGASDGASVMTGPINGVVACIKVKVPLFLATHCVAHRLSLAAVDASGDSRSTVHTQHLREIKKAINDPLLKMTRATDMRWLSQVT